MSSSVYTAMKEYGLQAAGNVFAAKATWGFEKVYKHFQNPMLHAGVPV